MSDDRLVHILDAAYACFARHGLRRTTMEDIAQQAGVSRPTVYQYVDNKEDAFRRLTARLLDRALADARLAPDTPGSLEDRLTGILQTKLDLTLQVWRGSPAHAAELLGGDLHVSPGPFEAYTAAYADLLASVLRERLSDEAALEVAEVLLALVCGLEGDLTDPARPGRLLRRGVDLLVAGLTEETR